MKKYLIVFMTFFLAIGLTVRAKDTEIKKDPVKKLSYALGVDMGKRIDSLNKEIDLETFIRGLKDKIEDKEVLLNKSEVRETITQMKKEVQRKRREKRKKTGKKNLKKGRRFLKKNKKKEGVKVTKSGLQYKILKEGTGPGPKANDKVRVHYVGKHLNGEVFESSRKRGKPVEFPLNKVISGWTEGVKLMKVGAKYRFWIPSRLAYGKKGALPRVDSNETLIFEIELLDIVSKKKRK